MSFQQSPKTERPTKLQVKMTLEWPPLLPLLLPGQTFFGILYLPIITLEEMFEQMNLQIQLG